MVECSLTRWLANLISEVNDSSHSMHGRALCSLTMCSSAANLELKVMQHRWQKAMERQTISCASRSTGMLVEPWHKVQLLLLLEDVDGICDRDAAEQTQ